MLNEEKVKEVLELIATKQFSCREIAAKTGISRAVINRLANGKRKLKPQRKVEELKTNWNSTGRERCPECGAMVYQPCFGCLIRKTVRKQNASIFGDILSETTKLELEEKHRLRYEQVKTWREKQTDPNFIELPDDWPFRKTCVSHRRKNQKNITQQK